MSAPTVPPIQFTKGELRLIERAAAMMTVEWLNGLSEHDAPVLRRERYAKSESRSLPRIP